MTSSDAPFSSINQSAAHDCCLSQLMPNIDWQHVADIPFASLCLDTRELQPKDAFVLLKSAVNHDDTKSAGYAAQASSKAALILSEIDLTPYQDDISTAWLYTPSIRDYLGTLQQLYLQACAPTSLPEVIAITGTNGKTTVSQLIAQLLSLTTESSSKHCVGVLGTTGNGIWPNLQPASHTTSDVLSMHTQLHQFGKQGAEVLCLEASSHGLHQQRLQGVPISTAIFTNLSRDHLDYHTDMDNYAHAKSRLFEWPDLDYAIINSDDAYADTMIAAIQRAHQDTDANIDTNENLCGHEPTIWRYSITSDNTGNRTTAFYVNAYHAHAQGVRISLHTPQGHVELFSPLLGIFNVSNLVAAVAATLAQGIPLAKIVQAVPKLHGAEGRMQSLSAFGANFVVDYAHTPDALLNALKSLRIHAPDSSLTVVFGCGGDRDTGKRPLMTQAALAYADTIIITADNPRSESIEHIIDDMLAGLSDDELANITVQADRRCAIALAVNNATEGDVVLIAGKGHETYQEINGTRYDFDDRAALAQAITQRNTQNPS